MEYACALFFIKLYLCLQVTCFVLIKSTALTNRQVDKVVFMSNINKEAFG